MIVSDLIKNKDYDYISWRLYVNPDIQDIFAGICKSKNGKLISLDGDTIYSKDEEVISYSEWQDGRIKNGLTVMVKMPSEY